MAADRAHKLVEITDGLEAVVRDTGIELRVYSPPTHSVQRVFKCMLWWDNFFELIDSVLPLFIKMTSDRLARTLREAEATRREIEHVEAQGSTAHRLRERLEELERMAKKLERILDAVEKMRSGLGEVMRCARE